MDYNGTVLNLDCHDLAVDFSAALNGDYSNFKEKAEKYIEQYFNRGISDLLFCVFTQASLSHSKVIETIADKYDMKLENGIEVDYKNVSPVKIFKWSEDNGIDIYDIWIKYTKKNGVRPWISFRMNDVHGWDKETSVHRADFFYKARENGWLLPFGNCYNYAVPEVYNRMINYIREQVMHYDVHGIELDFMREIVCFDYKANPDCYLIMNNFIREVKKITVDAAEKFGHPIKIMVRLPRDIKECKEYGFDALTWAKDGNVDVIVPSSHYMVTDSDMPIDRWVEALKPYNVDVYAGIEDNLNAWKGLKNNLETVKGFIVQYASLGSAKEYFFNYYTYNFTNGTIKSIDDFGNIYHYAEKYSAERVDIWNISSDLSKARKGVRRHIMTEQLDNSDRGYKGWEPLPKEVDGKAHFDILTGEILKNEKAVLYVGLDGGDVSVSINGAKADGVPDTDGAYVHTSEKLECENIYAFEFTADESLKRQSVDIEGKCTVKYLEVKVTGES